MAYDDLKKIAGVRVGALPLFTLGGNKATAPPKTPQVIPSPASALKLALGRSGARDLRVAVLSPTRAAPVAAIASSVLGTSTASAALQGAAAGAPAPAPMPMLNAVPASLANIAAAAKSLESRGIDIAPLAPPTHDSRDEPPPMLAALPPAPSTALVVDHHGDDAPPPPPPALEAARPLLAALPAGPISDVIRKAAEAPPTTRTTRTYPGASDDAPSRSFTQVDRSAPAAPQVTRGSLLFNGPASRGSNDVQRSSASRTNDRTTTKGRSIMASRYRGTGEITYCPVNSDGPINAGASSTLPGVRPQKPFQSQELLIDGVTGATFDISDIKIGNEPVGVAAGSVSAANFPPANGPKFSWKVADGVDIIFSVENTGTLTVAFSAMLVGEVCEPIA